MDFQVTSMSDSDKYDAGGGVTRMVDAQILIGKFGPFRVQVVKDANWETNMRTAIDAEVRRVKALTT